MTQTDLAALADRLATVLTAADMPLGALIVIDLGPDGALVIDGRGPAPQVTFGPPAEAARATADCILTITAPLFERILAGDLDETAAFMQGDLQITGDAAAAARLNDSLRARRA